MAAAALDLLQKLQSFEFLSRRPGFFEHLGALDLDLVLAELAPWLVEAPLPTAPPDFPAPVRSVHAAGPVEVFSLRKFLSTVFARLHLPLILAFLDHALEQFPQRVSLLADRPVRFRFILKPLEKLVYLVLKRFLVRFVSFNLSDEGLHPR